MMVHSVLVDIVLSALASNDVMVLIKLRMLVEYATKAAYFIDHPTYALYMMTVGEAKDIQRRVQETEMDAEAVREANEHLADMKTKFPSVAQTKRVTIEKMITNYSNRDSYVWLYGAPSALLHGDAEGIRTIFSVLPDGQQRPTITFAIERVNAMVVDAGINALLFCDHFLEFFSPPDQGLITRSISLNVKLRHLVLRHAHGRDEEVLKAVKDEIEILMTPTNSMRLDAQRQ